MNELTFEEKNLLVIYNSAGTREGLIAALEDMRGYLEPDEAELRELTGSALDKLRAMSDNSMPHSISPPISIRRISPMTNKLQAALQLANDTARQITGSYQAWTAFLTTAARLYKDVCCKG